MFKTVAAADAAQAIHPQPCAAEDGPLAGDSRDVHGGRQIAGGRCNQRVEHQGGALFVKDAYLSAPIVADDFGVKLERSTLNVPGHPGPVLASERGGVLLDSVTVVGDIVCGGTLGFSACNTSVKGDIHTTQFCPEKNVHIEGRVRVAAASTLVGSGCHVDAMELSPAASYPDFPPNLCLLPGASVGRVECPIPGTRILLGRNASIREVVGGTNVKVSRSDSLQGEDDGSCPIMSAWSFGRRPMGLPPEPPK